MFRKRARAGCRLSLLWDRPVAPARRCFVRCRCRSRCPGLAPRSACESTFRGRLLLLYLLLRLALLLVSVLRRALLPLFLLLRRALLLLFLLLRRALLLLVLLLRFSLLLFVIPCPGSRPAPRAWSCFGSSDALASSAALQPAALPCRPPHH